MNKIKKDYKANLGEIFKYIKDLTFKLEWDREKNIKNLCDIS